MKKLERVGDYGFDISRSMEAINQLIDEVEALKENQVTAIMETSDTMKIFWKDKHIVLKNPEPADDKPEKVTLHDIVANTPEGSAAVDRALERSAERQNEMKRKAEEIRDTHRTDKPFLCSSCKMTVLGLNPDDTMCSSCKAKDKPDTHRTVTLRIPKGMRIGEALQQAWLDDKNSFLLELSDTDLQKALDEVEHE